MKKVLAGFIFGVVMAGCASAAAKNTDNDHILRGEQGDYQEYFKQDGDIHSDKNYLYTVTHQDAPDAGKCDVYTFASETAGAVVCNIPGGNR